METDELTGMIVDTAFHIQRDLGPGLLESVYELVLAAALQRRGLKVERQKPVSFTYDGMMLRAYTASSTATHPLRLRDSA